MVFDFVEWQFAFQLLEIGLSAPLSQGSMMLFCGLHAAMFKNMDKIANPTNENRTEAWIMTGRSPFSHLSHPNPNPNSYPNLTLNLNLTPT